MDVNDLLATAWAAVQASGVPAELQETAFKEAVAYLRDSPGGGASEQVDEKVRVKPAAAQTQALSNETAASNSGAATEDEFFSRLADESGVEEKLLRDTLQLAKEGKVHVIQPTRQLGSSVAEQARTVIPLIAAARCIGLGESPVQADAVRDELKRKRCFDQANFSSGHLSKLDGFNAGGTRAEIVLSSKWVKEFVDAIARVHGAADAAAE